jgi:peroxiredoxin Q/BCP
MNRSISFVRLKHLLAGLSLLLVASVMAAPADFTVVAPVDGKTFRLSEARGKYVALHFLLKTECPICLRHTRAYAQKAASMPDVVQVFLKPDSAEEIKGWSGKANDTSNQVTVYRDPDAKLAKEFNIPGGYQFHGEVVHYPALIVLDPQGKEVFRYGGKNNTDRFTVEQFEAKLKELKAKAAEVK